MQHNSAWLVTVPGRPFVVLADVPMARRVAARHGATVLDMTTLPYGSWPSVVTPDLAVAAAARVSDICVEQDVTWWSVARPAEGGRLQIVRRDAGGATTDLLPEPFNARTRVHEYGGGAWWVDRGRVFFTHFGDQRLYRLDPGAADPVAISEEPPAPASLRYADGVLSDDGRTVICVRQRHETGDAGQPAVHNELVALPAAGGSARILTGGHDFYAAPRLSPDGARLAWLTWDHPDMPWDATTLWVAEVVGAGESLSLNGIRAVAGEPGESLTQPEWSPAGDLYVISDRNGWWNVYRVEQAEPDRGAELVAVHPVEAEVGLPAWVFRRDRYAIGRDGTVWFTYSDEAGAHLSAARPDGTGADLTTGYLGIEPLRLSGDRIVALATAADREPSVVQTTDGGASWTTLLAGGDHDLPAVSVARRVDFPSAGGRVAHGLFYAPVPAAPSGTEPFEAPDGELPPLVVEVHGGPTSQARPGFSLGTQFWTSRGFAVLDVDYGGSTGYGRPYRRLLDDAWGIVDVQDAQAGARHLAEQGLVDADRMVITGGSAGGYTVLMCLATGSTFSAGASHYGVTDLGALARDTHKFESRYLDRLVGPWPEAEATYVERSPMSHLDGLDAPLIVLQGSEDEVVPPSQAEAIVAALRERAVPHAYLLFEGEQHGFRKAENVRRALTAELSFYGQVFGCAPAGDIEPVEIITGP